MSILLLGARFPQNGSPLSCIIQKDCRVITSYETGTGIMRCDDFKAVELPPHGRLIDADALKSKYGEWYTEEGPEEGFIGTIGALIDNAPTIIESEHVRCG